MEEMLELDNMEDNMLGLDAMADMSGFDNREINTFGLREDNTFGSIIRDGIILWSDNREDTSGLDNREVIKFGLDSREENSLGFSDWGTSFGLGKIEIMFGLDNRESMFGSFKTKVTKNAGISMELKSVKQNILIALIKCPVGSSSSALLCISESSS